MAAASESDGQEEAAADLRRILAAVVATPEQGSASAEELAGIWERLAAHGTAPPLGCLLVAAGAFLWSPVRVGTGALVPELPAPAAVTDANALRMELAAGVVWPGAVKGPLRDAASQDRERAVAAAQRKAAPWAEAPARTAAAYCLQRWAPGLALQVDDARQARSSELAKVLPEVLAVLRGEASQLDSAHWSAARGRALLVVFSMHWLIERAHYTDLRDRLGLCLPTLLKTLDVCTDEMVRLVGLDVLHLILDRAMAVEVQNFGPPLVHCFSISSPLFMQGDILGELTVAPYCAALVLFLSKGFASQGALQQEVLDRFLSFGTTHCKGHSRAFRLFLEFGLIPLLRRNVMLTFVRFGMLVEFLLQATEVSNAAQVLLAWEAFLLLLGCETLRPRVRRYTLDVLLRLAFTHLTYVASRPPGSNDRQESSTSHEGFVSPIMQGMTDLELDLAETHRDALRDVLERVAGLLSFVDAPHVERLLVELEGEVQALSRGSCGIWVEKQGLGLAASLQDFARFARSPAHVSKCST